MNEPLFYMLGNIAGALSAFGALAVVDWVRDRRRRRHLVERVAGLRNARADTYTSLRDENGYYTKLKPTDSGYPYGTSEGLASDSVEQSNVHALSLRDEVDHRFAELRLDGVETAVKDHDRSQDDSQHGLVDVHDVRRGVVGVVSSGCKVDLSIEPFPHPHDASPSVMDVEGATSASSDQTVGETADTAAIGSAIPFGSQRTVGGRGAAASSGPAVPHSEPEGEQQ